MKLDLTLPAAEAATGAVAQPVAPLSAKGADLIARTLVDIGVDTVFCYPGGANLEMLDALSRVAITLVRTEHEQGSVFGAQGYARATGKLGVCLATSGPGATNLVTGIADAASDSVPVLAITGNVATHWLGKNAFQEVDIVAITRPVTKLARQVREPRDIPAALREAAACALAGRPGPVLLDFPKDIQQARPDQPTDKRFTAPVPAGMSDETAQRIAALLAKSERPVIYAGGGVIASGTGARLVALAEALDCPVALTMMGLGAMPDDHPLLLGPLGMHGAYAANVAVNEADLVLALGVRFDDRVIGDPASFARHAKIVHVDVDAAEIGKNKPVTLGVHADLRDAFAGLLAHAKRRDVPDWHAYLRERRAAHPLRAAQRGASEVSGAQDTAGETSTATVLTGVDVISALAALLPPQAIVTTGVGQHQMWAMQHLRLRQPRTFLSSAGFGTMGFGLPAAIGAKVALPDVPVIDIDGDGSLNMSVNELSTCRRYGLGVKVLVINNQWLGMVRQWQDMIYARNRVASSLVDPNVPEGADDGRPYPDFVTIAAGYGVAGARVTRAEELPAALARMLEDPSEPYLLDVLVAREDDVYPMIPAGKTYRDVVFGPGQAAGPIAAGAF
ncbi:biosynthetic-type acetolactate synthase large subunit [Pandoraea fibrosis]|uniref:Acetolactate synthase n=1 Tax=Pandoraea fibrosis TaxID=1891094 RepID=A0ABX6HS13_9BURK|nr:biosynthetic-type acetolactate synthase large subunit [Pandoraea fibrosis]QHE92740.1 biosynthetic-type acetolactate synthase large subunit [Pandoraea fibrosis]QHF13703.1 biosynthetic-type acetolactate synthase large subunit [Pandoraea fibrosis]